MSRLKLADHLSLPLETVTQTIAILAKRRAGKSYTMRRLVEQLFKAGQQVVLVDPKGDQWGLRSAADGKAPGLPIVILGGERGDVPLESSAGEIVAKLVVEERVSVLLDLSLFRKHEVATFMTAFLENLYRLKAKEVYRTPVMLVIDEADAVAPQKPQKGEERMLGAAEDIVRRGGQRGIGCVLVTQRSAVLNKNVLTQAQVLIVLRTIAPQDLAAMKAWIDVHGDEEQGRTLMDSLPSLPTGDAWFWSPGWPTVEGIFKRVHVLPIETFDSGASPAPGVKPVEPKNLADVDLNALKGQMAATIEKAKADDPRELRKQIADLKKELSKPGQIVPTGTNSSKPILTDADRALLEKWTGAIAESMKSSAFVLEQADVRLDRLVQKAIAEYLQTIRTVSLEQAGMLEQLFDRIGIRKILDKLATVQPAQAISRHPVSTRAIPTSRSSAATRPAETRAPRVSDRPGVAGDLNKAEQRILDALAWWRSAGVEEPTRIQVAFVARYTVNGHFNNTVGALRSKDLVDYPSSGGIRLTTAGAAAAYAPEEGPTRDELIERVLAVLRTEPQQRIFKAIVAAGQDISREELAAATRYTVNGHFNNTVGSLRSLGVIDYPSKGGVRLADLFEALS
jgi:hypothetical protein